MGKVYSSLIVRPLKNLNIEASAHKVIDKNVKPKIAPRHISSQEYIESYINENSKTLDSDIKEKNDDLHKRLEGMVVEVNKFGEIRSTGPDHKQLPGVGHTTKVHDLSVEPEVTKDGHITLKQLTDLLTKHSTDPTKYKAEQVSGDYKITLEDAEKILAYFKVFLVQVPKKPSEWGKDGKTDLLPEEIKRKIYIESSTDKY